MKDLHLLNEPIVLYFCSQNRIRTCNNISMMSTLLTMVILVVVLWCRLRVRLTPLANVKIQRLLPPPDYFPP